MHTAFYTSGFLFHLESQQILLHQPQQQNDSPLWSMFGGINYRQEDGAVTFQQIIHETLGIKLARKHIYPVYDYFHPTYHKIHYVYYAQVPKMRKYTFGADNFSWFTFKQTLKLPFTEQTRQDIVVGQRVIEAAQRVIMHTQYYPLEDSFKL